MTEWLKERGYLPVTCAEEWLIGKNGFIPAFEKIVDKKSKKKSKVHNESEVDGNNIHTSILPFPVHKTNNGLFSIHTCKKGSSNQLMLIIIFISAQNTTISKSDMENVMETCLIHAWHTIFLVANPTDSQIKSWGLLASARSKLAETKFAAEAKLLSDKKMCPLLAESKILAECKEEGPQMIEVLSLSEIKIPKMESRLVPRYRILTEEEIVAAEKKRCTTRLRFLPMFREDAIARYMGYPEGTVLLNTDSQELRLVIKA